MNIIYKMKEYFFPKLITSKAKIKYLKKNGVVIGKGTFLFNAGSILIDASRPELLEIGEYCKITGGVTILTHDYSRSVLRRVYGEIIAEAKKTVIGNNVFIGINSIILMGTIIGDNSIVGAGSVCSGKYPANSVIAGNPARVIMSLEDYYNKRKEQTIKEAINYAKILYDKNGKIPTIEKMGAFFPQYLKRNKEELKINNLKTNLSGDDENEIIEFFLNSNGIYKSYDDFIKKILEKE